MKQEKFDETLKILEEIGQEDEVAGVKATKKYVAAWNQKNSDEDLRKVAILKKKKNATETNYFKLVASMIREGLDELDIEDDIKTSVTYSKKGVVIKMFIGDKTHYRAFRPIRNPEVDYSAMVGLLSQALDTSDLHYVSKKEEIEIEGKTLEA